MSPSRQIAYGGFCTALHDQCPENPFWPVSDRKLLDPNRPIMADHRRTDSRELRRLYTQVRIFGHTNVSITRNVGPDCRTGVSYCGGFTRFRRRCGSGSGLPNGEGWWAAMPSSGSARRDEYLAGRRHERGVEVFPSVALVVEFIAALGVLVAPPSLGNFLASLTGREGKAFDV